MAFFLGVAAVLWLLVVPTYSRVSESGVTGGNTTRTSGTGTILDANGFTLLGPLLVPIVLLVAPVISQSSVSRRAITAASAVFLTVFVVIASFSIGLMFLPAAATLWVAVPGSTSRPSG
jgi:hypothetical protein